MPATASIIIEVDAKNAGQSVDQLNAKVSQLEPSLKRSGDRGNVVFTDLTKRTEQARDAAQLFANVTGVQLPRALEKVIAKSQSIGPALATAFNVAVVAQFAVIALQQIGDLYNKIIESNRQLQQILGENETKRLEDNAARSDALLQTNRQLTLKIATQTAGDLTAIDKELAIKREELHRQFNEAALFGDVNSQILISNQVVEMEKDAAQRRLLIRRGWADQTRKLEEQAEQAALDGIGLVDAQEAAALNSLGETYNRGKIDFANFERQLTAIQQLSAAQRQKIARDEDDGTRRLAEQSLESRLKGIDAINAAEQDAKDELDVLHERQIIDDKNYYERRSALEYQFESQRIEIERRANEQTQQFNEDAAVAAALPWDRANVQIRVDAERRIREIQQELQDSTITEQQAAAQISAVWQQTFAQMRDSLADQLEGLFDDITSGNIGRRFLNNFKKLVFEMIASWLLGIRQMQTASAFSFGGGGLLSGLFGGLLGIGGFGGSGAQSIGPGGTAPFSGILGGGSSGGGLLGTLFGGGLLGGLFGGSSSAAGGLGSLPTVLSSSQLGNLGLTALPLSAGGGIGGGGVLPAGASAAVGGKLAGLAGGLAGLAIGGGIGLIGLAGKAGPFGGAALGALGGLVTTGGLIAAFPAILGALGAATLGIGALIGGIIGLFAGLFGGGKRQRAVEQLGKQVKDQIQKIEDAYNTHQIDASGAISQLEQLRTTAHQQMHKLGGDTHTRVEQPVDAAEKYINDTEAERTRRLAVAFGPAQFHEGGFVGGHLARPFPGFFGARALHYASGGEVPAVLHAGEYVLRPEAVRRIGTGALDAMNHGGGPWSGVLQVHVHALDSKSVDYWLRNGGDRAIAAGLRRAMNEGRI
jgi:gas vesicle protein/Rps23 Pro-64 3,4-dihydroxylase Tpa1-like proline 4-hydroxylase